MKKGEGHKYTELAETLKIDCAQCSGLCCVALYCMKTDGFPANKDAGSPCRHLQTDFRCAIHSTLVQKKLKGCLAYDCFGAGQKTTQLYEKKGTWKANAAQAEEIFAAFVTVFHLHQMLWYLIEAYTLTTDEGVKSRIDMLITENQQMVQEPQMDHWPSSLEQYRTRVNEVLKQILRPLSRKNTNKAKNRDYFGKDFKRANLDESDFSMSLLVAANLEGCSLQGTSFLGADLRDANIKDADMSKSIFLTQMQLNSAKGNEHTKIPESLSRPASWPLHCKY